MLPIRLIKTRAGQKLGYQLHRNLLCCVGKKTIIFFSPGKKQEQYSTFILAGLKIIVNIFFTTLEAGFL